MNGSRILHWQEQFENASYGLHLYVHRNIRMHFHPVYYSVTLKHVSMFCIINRQVLGGLMAMESRANRAIT